MRTLDFLISKFIDGLLFGFQSRDKYTEESGAHLSDPCWPDNRAVTDSPISEVT